MAYQSGRTRSARQLHSGAAVTPTGTQVSVLTCASQPLRPYTARTLRHGLSGVSAVRQHNLLSCEQQVSTCQHAGPPLSTTLTHAGSPLQASVHPPPPPRCSGSGHLPDDEQGGPQREDRGPVVTACSVTRQSPAPNCPSQVSPSWQMAPLLTLKLTRVPPVWP